MLSSFGNIVEVKGIELNILTGLGYFFTGIGLLVLFAALFIGTTAYDAVSSIPSNPSTGNQLGQAAFLTAFTPYGVASGVLLSLGVMSAIIANSRKPNNVSVNSSINISTPYGNKLSLTESETKSLKMINKPTSDSPDENELPLPNQGICPSCESPMVFIEKYQRWYCVNERKYI